MRRKLCNVFTLIALLTVILNLTFPAVAAEEALPVIDGTKKASLTLYKYDITRATEAGAAAAGTIAATGQKQSAVETAYGAYAIEGVVFTCYKLGDIRTCQIIEENVPGVTLVYGVTEDAAEVLELEEADAAMEESGNLFYTADQLTAALNAMMTTDASAIAAGNALEALAAEASSGVSMPETASTGKTTLQNMDQGLYLVVETSVPENVSRTTTPFFVSLPMTNVSGTEWIYDVTCYPKNTTDQPELKKEVAEVTGDTAGTYSDTATASEGDILAYQITSYLPEITTSATYLTKYTFEDTADAGLTYRKVSETENSADCVSITWYDTAGDMVDCWAEDDAKPMFTVKITSGASGKSTMTIAMTEDGLAEINGDDTDMKKAGTRGYSEYKMVIDYRADLDSDDTAVPGDQGNANSVTLTWSRTGTDYEDTLEDSCRVYTYGLDITKVFGIQVTGADYTKVGFEIENVTDSCSLQAVSSTDGVYYLTAADPKQEATVFHPDADGNLLICGLEDDTYRITEITTSAGYNLLKEDLEITIKSTAKHPAADTGNDLHHDGADSAGHYIHVGSASVNEEAVTMEKSGTSANALVPVTVINTRGYDIPQTGESGTFLLPLMGLIGVGGLLIFTGRLKRENR